jgi:hypothetical protein
VSVEAERVPAGDTEERLEIDALLNVSGSRETPALPEALDEREDELAFMPESVVRSGIETCVHFPAVWQAKCTAFEAPSVARS